MCEVSLTAKVYILLFPSLLLSTHCCRGSLSSPVNQTVWVGLVYFGFSIDAVWVSVLSVPSFLLSAAGHMCSCLRHTMEISLQCFFWHLMLCQSLNPRNTLNGGGGDSKENKANKLTYYYSQYTQCKIKDDAGWLPCVTTALMIPFLFVSESVYKESVSQRYKCSSQQKYQRLMLKNLIICLFTFLLRVMRRSVPLSKSYIWSWGQQIVSLV